MRYGFTPTLTVIVGMARAVIALDGYVASRGGHRQIFAGMLWGLPFCLPMLLPLLASTCRDQSPMPAEALQASHAIITVRSGSEQVAA